MENKTQPTDEIKKIKIGSKDTVGNVITDVLAFGNEYAIYEIETENINKKLRVIIDGVNDERENKIAKDYAEVKDKYITAKGLLYRTSNFGLMKNRVAHSLATALTGNPSLANEQFEKLILQINNEYKETYMRRLYYIVPGYVLLTAFTVILALNTIKNWDQAYKEIFDWLYVAYASIIGGVFSLTLNLPKIKFETEIGGWIFSVFGIERISISILAGIICFVGIKSKFILANLFKDPIDLWSLLFVIIIAAFSEKMVPNIIKDFIDKEIRT